jgi:hypothetical protein
LGGLEKSGVLLWGGESEHGIKPEGPCEAIKDPYQNYEFNAVLPSGLMPCEADTKYQTKTIIPNHHIPTTNNNKKQPLTLLD